MIFEAMELDGIIKKRGDQKRRLWSIWGLLAFRAVRGKAS